MIPLLLRNSSTLLPPKGCFSDLSPSRNSTAVHILSSSKILRKKEMKKIECHFSMYILRHGSLAHGLCSDCYTHCAVLDVLAAKVLMGPLYHLPLLIVLHVMLILFEATVYEPQTCPRALDAVEYGTSYFILIPPPPPPPPPSPRRPVVPSISAAPHAHGRSYLFCLV